MAKEKYVSVKQLAKGWGIHTSNARRYVLAQGFAFEKQRTATSGGQLANVLSQEDAEAIRAIREAQGFTGKVVANHTQGWLYIVRLIPDLDPLRVKLGFASDVKARLQAHRTAAPTARLVKSWSCRRTWEQAAIDSITRMGCKLISNEVFQCDDLDALTRRADEFFNLMPQSV